MSGTISEEQTQRVLALSEMMVMLANSRGTYNEQRLLNLMSIKEYLNDGANKVAQMWVDKKLDKDDYHELMSYFRAAWAGISRIIEEDFELKQEYQIPIRLQP